MSVWVLWSGKFPRTSCFGEFVSHKVVQMGSDVYISGQMGADGFKGKKGSKNKGEIAPTG